MYDSFEQIMFTMSRVCYKNVMEILSIQHQEKILPNLMTVLITNQHKKPENVASIDHM